MTVQVNAIPVFPWDVSEAYAQPRLTGPSEGHESGPDLHCQGFVRSLCSNWRSPPRHLMRGPTLLEATAMTTSIISRAARPTSALSVAAAAFTHLTQDPDPVLTLDCDTLGTGLGLPAGIVSLAVVRDWMLANRTAHDARDVVWREVITRARSDHTGDGLWVIAAIGLAMPALVSRAHTLAAGYRGDPDDLDAEILTGFLTALRAPMDVARPALYAKLIYAGWRAGLAARQQDGAYVASLELTCTTVTPRSPERPYQHPDLLVQRAADLGLLDPGDAAAFVDVRLAGHRVDTIAEHHGVSVDCLRRRLQRADAILVQALSEGLLSGPVPAPVRDRWAATAVRRARIRSARTTPTAAVAPTPESSR